MAITGTDGSSGAIDLDIFHRTEQPTAQLRFVERGTGLVCEGRTVRILQQRWEIVDAFCSHVRTISEWRDVPLELELEG